MVNHQIERINMADVFQARYVLQCPDDHQIARDAVEPQNRARHVADSFLAFRTQGESEVYRQAMRADAFEVVDLPLGVWLEACRGFMQEGLTYGASIPLTDDKAQPEPTAPVIEYLLANDRPD